MPRNHSAIEPAATPGWNAYYDKAGLGPPRPTLLRALRNLATDGVTAGHAVDLGCGVGRDALALLARGWRVTGVDREPDALARLVAEAATRGLPAPAVICAPFESGDIPPCELVNASFALFSCSPELFPDLWRRIRNSLAPGGRFAGQLLGANDSWATRPTMTCHQDGELRALLAGYAVEWLEREQTDAITPRGEAKRWDIWHLVLRRPA